MNLEHAEHVVDFIAGVFGAEPVYSTGGGSHLGMIARHLKREITEEQRVRWLELMVETADEIDLPKDRAFRDTFVAYLD